jgi:hypothetical protein
LTKIGDGYVSVDADLDPFWRRINREISTLDAKFKSAGRSSGKSFGDGFSGVDRDLSRVRSALQGADRDSRRASKGFAGLASSFGGGGGVRKFARDLDDFGGAADGATATIGGFRIAVAGLVPVLVAFSGASVAAASSLAPLIGLTAGAGNALGAAAQGLGVFKLASSGISDALKEQTTNHAQAASAAVSSAGQQRGAARAIQSAQDEVRQALESVSGAESDLSTAQKDATTAQKALTGARTNARRALVDMHDSLAQATIAASEAVFGLQDAQKALATLQAGASQQQLADASRAVTESFHGQQQAALSLLKAQESLDKLTQSAADAEKRRAGAATALANAQRNLEAVQADVNATYDERTHALELVASATKAVNDANASAQVSDLDKKQAVLDVVGAQDALTASQAQAIAAQTELTKLQSGPTDDEKAHAVLDVTAAQLQLVEAQRELVRQQKDTAAADKAGVEGSKEVIDAKAAIADANTRVRDAEKAISDAQRDVARSQQALSDAQLSANEEMVKGSVATANLNEKFNELSPAAQRFVLKLKELKPRFDELKATAASGLFPGVTAGLDAAMGSFGSVNRVVGETSVVLGEAARRSGELVGSPAFGKDIETIGGNNARVIETLGEALRHVISALRHVTVAAGPLTQWLADVANGWALNAAQAAKAGRESGKMAAFFERTRAVMERLGSIIGHLAHGLLGVGKVGRVSGNQIWASIDRAAGRFDEWANSAKGQTALHDFFRRSKELAGALVPVMASVAQAVAMLALKFLPLTTVLRILGPYADEATVAFVGYKLAVIATGIATKAATAAVWAHGIALKIQSVNMVRWRLMLAAAAIASGVATAAQWALNIAMTANPIGLVIVAISALVAGFVLLGGKLSWIGDAFTAVWGAIKSAASTVIDWLTSNWPAVLGILAGPVDLALAALRNFGPKMLEAASWLLSQFVAGVKAYVAAVIAVGGWLVTQIVTGIKAVAGFAADVGGWIKNRVVDGVHAVIGGFTMLGGWIVNRIVDGFRVVTDALASVGGWLRNRIVELVHLAVDGFVSVGGWILNRIVDGFKLVTEALGSIGGWLRNRVVEAMGAVKDGFVSVGSSIIGWIVDGLKGGANLLIDFVNKIIHVINKIPGVDIDDVKHFAEGGINERKSGPNGNGPLATRGFAHGGAFARTGGVVNSPITLMGEEAPRMPEFVIPTNPAYRSRARMLLAQAAQAIGLAKGGRYSQSDMENLWAKHGGGDKRIAGAVGMAESAGDPNASNGPYHGLWQVGPGGPFDPDANAQAAIAKWRAGGDNIDARWKPWQAYTGPDGIGSDGPFRRFMNGGGGVLGAIGGAISGVGGVLGDLLSKGAGFITSRLPDIGDLPGWLKGTGTYALGKVKDWIASKVSSLVGGGGSGASKGEAGVGSFEGVPMANWVIDALTYGRNHGAHGKPTSGYRPGFDPHTSSGRSEHQGTRYPHGAVDFGGFNSGLAEKMSYVRATHGFKYPLVAPIGFHDDGHASGTGHKMGGVYGLLPHAGSFANGGIVPGPVGVPASAIVHGGEGIVQNGAGLVASLERNSAELREFRLRGIGVLQMTDRVGERLGDQAVQRRMTPGNPAVTAIF